MHSSRLSAPLFISAYVLPFVMSSTTLILFHPLSHFSSIRPSRVVCKSLSRLASCPVYRCFFVSLPSAHVRVFFTRAKTSAFVIPSVHLPSPYISQPHLECLWHSYISSQWSPSLRPICHHTPDQGLDQLLPHSLFRLASQNRFQQTKHILGHCNPYCYVFFSIPICWDQTPRILEVNRYYRFKSYSRVYMLVAQGIPSISKAGIFQCW